MNQQRILLAEDSPNDVELTLEAFREQNLANRVDVVHDGVQVLEYLNKQGEYSSRESGDPILILLDLKMPKLDGLQVLQELKNSSSNLKTIPVVILTSSREESDLVDSYDLGVNGYVVKPVDFDRFMESIRHIGLYWVLTNEPPPMHGPNQIQ